MEIQKTCKVCQQTFQANRRNQIYCSTLCQRTNYDEKRRAEYQGVVWDQICNQCGEKFTGRRRQFCNYNCKKAFQNTTRYIEPTQRQSTIAKLRRVMESMDRMVVALEEINKKLCPPSIEAQLPTVEEQKKIVDVLRKYEAK